MISKELEKKVDETVSGAITQEALFANPEPAAVETPDIIAESSVGEQGILEAEEVSPAPEPIEVAGLGGLAGIGEKISKRVQEAESRVVSPIKDEPVQEIGGQLVIREDQANVDELNRVLGGDYTKGLNFPKIEGLGPIDAEQYTQNLKNLNADLFEQQRRGTLSMEKIEQLANSKDLSKVVYDWALRPAGQAATAEDLLAGVIALDRIMRDIDDKVNVIATLEKGADRDAATTEVLQLMNLEAQIAANVSGATSEAGRALYTARQLQQAGLPNASRRIDQLYGLESAQDIEHLLQLYKAIPNPGGKLQFLKSGIGKTVDVMMEIWINSILSSPVTHAVNIAGNTSFAMLNVLETGMASIIGKGRGAITGNKADRVRAAELIGQLEGIKGGAFDAFLVAGKVLFTETPTEFASKIDIRNRRAIGTTGDPREIVQEFRKGNVIAGATNVIGSMLRLSSRALLAEDELFKGIGYRTHINRMAALEGSKAYDGAIAAGKTKEEALGIAAERKAEIMLDPPSGLVADSKQAAREMTFQGDLPGFWGDAQYLFSHPLMKLFVPFYKTPANIMREAFIRTPIPLFTGLVFENSVTKALKAGGREADIALGKITTGSMMMGFMSYLSMGLVGEENDIVVVGAGPTDLDARRSFANQNMQPYSINIRNYDDAGNPLNTYTSITYSRFDPVSGILAIAADFAYYAQYEDDPDILEGLATAATLAVSEYAMQQPMLQGVAEIGFAASQTDPKLRAEMMTELFTEKLAGVALSAVPSVSSFGAAAERVMDPTRRTTELPPGKIPFTDVDITDAPSWGRGFYSALQKAKERNPFFSKDLPPKLNDWGEEMTSGTGSGWEFINPVRIQQTKYAEVDAELQNLGGGISRTPRKIAGVRLNSVQIRRWKELFSTMDSFGNLPGEAGYDDSSTILNELGEYIFMDEYMNDFDGNPRDKDDKLNLITSKISNRRSDAKKQLKLEFPEIQEKIDAAK